MEPPRPPADPVAALDASQVVGEPVLFKGTVLRLVADGSGGWIETWDGSTWVKPSGPGPATQWVSGRRMTDAELMRWGICVPSVHKTRVL